MQPSHITCIGQRAKTTFWLILMLFAILQVVSGGNLCLANGQNSHGRGNLPPIRAAQIDLDYVYDHDKKQQDANIDLLVARVRELGINTVFLQAFADSNGNGTAEALYFPNKLIPMMENLFKPVSERLRKNGVAVYGWLPMLAFQIEERGINLYVQKTGKEDRTPIADNTNKRLSPFHPHAREILKTIYTDFASTTVVDGILFHDDATLTDFEDSSEAARMQYQKYGLPPEIDTIRNNKALFAQWSRYKTKYLIDFSLELIEIVRKQQPWVRSARNIFALPILEPESENWFAQSLPLFLKAYDYTAIMAMPFMENVANPDIWLRNLAETALGAAENTNRIIFEIQSKNWQTGQPIPGPVMLQQILLLVEAGGTSLAYYPDDFHKNAPPMKIIRTCFASPDPCSAIRNQ